MKYVIRPCDVFAEKVLLMPQKSMSFPLLLKRQFRELIGPPGDRGFYEDDIFKIANRSSHFYRDIEVSDFT